MTNKIPSYLLQQEPLTKGLPDAKKSKFSFIDRTVNNSAKAVKAIILQSEIAAKPGFINKINPHVKLTALLFFITAVSILNKISSQLIMTAFIFLLMLSARLNVIQVYRKILFLAFIFGFLVGLPAMLNIITPGKIIFNLISFARPSHFLIYNIPADIGITKEGCNVTAMLFLRVLNSVSVAMLVIFTTSFPALIKSFKILGVPDTFLMIIFLAYKYIFILSKTVEETYLAIKSRLIGDIKNKNVRKLIAGRIYFIFKKSKFNYENTYLAMVSRGYKGKIVLLSEKHFSAADFIALAVVISFSIFIILI